MSERVYLSSGWFTPSQRERRDTVLSILEGLGFDVYSPERDSLVSPDTSGMYRQTYYNNIDELNRSDFVVCITNENDPGTLFEAGLAYSYRVPTVYLAEGLEGPFNLMLAQSAALVATSMDDFKKYLSDASLVKKVVSSGGYPVIPYTGPVE